MCVCIHIYICICIYTYICPSIQHHMLYHHNRSHSPPPVLFGKGYSMKIERKKGLRRMNKRSTCKCVKI